VYRLARVHNVRVKDLLIRAFVRVFRVNVDEVAGDVPRDFACFNDFFTRELAAGSRPVNNASDTLIAPVDGAISAAGKIDRGTLVQAKGRLYTLRDLLATDIDDAGAYDDGAFTTIYLAPYDYHRVHAPWKGRLIAVRYVPGALFSVNDATAASVPNLFARNERLICHFVTDHGPMALIMVGALNVGSMTTPWTGELRPRKTNRVAEEVDIYRSGIPTRVDKGDLVGWFNMGSTVILLMPPGACKLDDDIAAGLRVRMGRGIARLQSLSA